VLPFGVEHLLDIQRLAAIHSIKIRCAFDVGAHVGETAVEFLAAFPGAQIYSFEPLPQAFAVVAGIGSERLHPFALAVSDKVGAADLYVRGDPTRPGNGPPSPNSSLVANRQFGLVTGQSDATIRVECDTIDRFCEQHDIRALDLLKIDTEGHEAEVLDGATETLTKRAVRFVFVEFETLLPVPGATGGALSPLAQRLEPLGFRLIATYPVGLIHKPLYTVFNALYFSAP